MSVSVVRWGISSTGNVAHDFTRALSYVPGARVTAVASRAKERAQAFIDENKLSSETVAAFGSNLELAASDAVDIVYIASPHSHHYQHAKECLEHGKHVLCEKAFTLTATQAQVLIELARAKGLFLMEAMWMRYLPAIRALVETHLPRIGEVVMARADYGFAARKDYERIYERSLGGGAILDIGVYTYTLISLAFRDASPDSIVAHGSLLPSGADEHCAMNFTFGPGRFASSFVSIGTTSTCEGVIIGRNGWIRVHNSLIKPTKITVNIGGKEEDFHYAFPEPRPDDQAPFRFRNAIGFVHEIDYVHECLHNNKTESEFQPLDVTLQVMKVLDQVRHQIGLRYPCEEENDQQ